MKIAIICRAYNKSGGISRHTAELAERLCQKYEVHIFTGSWKDVGTERIKFHKIPLLSFNFLKKFCASAVNKIFEVSSFSIASLLRINTPRV